MLTNNLPLEEYMAQARKRGQARGGLRRLKAQQRRLARLEGRKVREHPERSKR